MKPGIQLLYNNEIIRNNKKLEENINLLPKHMERHFTIGLKIRELPAPWEDVP